MNNLNRYHTLAFLEEPALGVGYAPPELRFDFLIPHYRYENWQPVTFSLREGEFADYQANDMHWHLCSPHMKSVIEPVISPDDTIQWLEVKVFQNAQEERTYYVLHFLESLDAFDKKKTLFAGKNFPVKPYLNRKVIGNRRLFSYIGRSTIYVTEDVKTLLITTNCTGIEFNEALVA